MKNALVAGIVTAIIWTLIQFGLSEVLYQVSRIADDQGMEPAVGTFFFTASDVIAFPAGMIYKEVEHRRIPVVLGEISTDRKLAEADRNAAREFRKKWHQAGEEISPELEEPTWDFIWNHYDGLIVPSLQEYAIYVGVCLAWGTLIGLIVFCFVLIEVNHQKKAADSS
jgi:hypothetical protein